jgi:glucosamine 6-phosphate synthetase-like amidotransferase/phosphosugar isomerase protein
MCGIFGYVAKKRETIDLAILRRLAIETETRGPHAFGFAWIDTDGRLRCYKQTGRISESLGLLRLARDAVALIGHCRYATHGNPEFNINNHPHPSDGGWVVHNGIIANHCELIRRHSLHLNSRCDSEVFAQLVERGEGDIVTRCGDAAQECEGSFAAMGLWKQPAALLAVRNGNPLHLGENEQGWYMASLVRGLPENAFMVRDASILCFSLGHKKNVLDAYDLIEQA